MGKTRFVVLLALLVVVLLNVFSVSALLEVNKDYKNNYDVWVYKQDMKGKIKSFSLSHIWSSPTYKLSTNNDNLFRTIDNQPPRDSLNAVRSAFGTFNIRNARTVYRTSYVPGFYSSSYSRYGYGSYGYYTPNSFW